jgi:hypothetical protein
MRRKTKLNKPVGYLQVSRDTTTIQGRGRLVLCSAAHRHTTAHSNDRIRRGGALCAPQGPRAAPLQGGRSHDNPRHDIARVLQRWTLTLRRACVG